jgi:phospholipase C
MDRLQHAGMGWRIYAPRHGRDGKGLPYGWAICPTFADCRYTPQHSNVVLGRHVITDARAGKLRRLSLVMPTWSKSQHNGTSMLAGDDWIGRVVAAIMRGPDWAHTAIFITYDDCGCFYDQVAPPAGLGIRVPMVIVSPYARAHFTDANVATFASMLAFTEHVFGLAPLSNVDRHAYDFHRAFNFRQRPLKPIRLTTRPVPRSERRWLARHRTLMDEPT